MGVSGMHRIMLICKVGENEGLERRNKRERGRERVAGRGAGREREGEQMGLY